MIYFVMFCLLLVWAVVIGLVSRARWSRWAVFFLFCSSLGPFSRFTANVILPLLDNESFLWEALSAARPFWSFTSHSVYQYAVCMFCIIYSGFFSKKQEQYLTYILLIPVIISGFFHPWDMKYHGIGVYAFRASWIVPYNLFSCSLLIHSYLKEGNRVIKRNRLFTTFIIVPTVLAGMVFITISDAVGIGEWQQNYKLVPYFVVYSFVLFLFFSVFNGVLGVKIRFENHLLSSNLRIMATSSDVINHAIKNEIIKIKYLSNKMKNNLSVKKILETSLSDLDQISATSEHLLEKLHKFTNKTAEITLNKEFYRVTDILEKVILNPNIEKNHVSIIKKYEYMGSIYCDRSHVEEALSNILNNAIEAIEAVESKGLITITTKKRRNQVCIEIEDTGCGIPPDHLRKVSIPFFSTKNSSENYGLGLSICLQVMQKHGGKMEILSKGRGTSVKLIFPIRRSRWEK
ncbi:sensor histidine kinase [Paenibacillus tarimensis]